MFVRLVNQYDLNKWLEMRMDLWPHCERDEHLEEMHGFLVDLNRFPVFVAFKNNEIMGFVEASIHEFAPGCHSSPVGYIEGWYVVPKYRHRGIGKKLIEAVEKWSIAQGFKEVASDAEVFNQLSILAHQKLGYKVVGKTVEEVKFIKELKIKEVFSNAKLDHVLYKERQCAYGVIVNGEKKIAVIKLAKGFYMPGGGMEGLESYAECIKRELLEEIGYDCEVQNFICKTREYFYISNSHEYRMSLGYFYKVHLKEKVILPIEKNHKLVWVSLDDAIKDCVPLFQKEALKYLKNKKLLD